MPGVAETVSDGAATSGASTVRSTCGGIVSVSVSGARRPYVASWRSEMPSVMPSRRVTSSGCSRDAATASHPNGSAAPEPQRRPSMTARAWEPLAQSGASASVAPCSVTISSDAFTDESIASVSWPVATNEAVTCAATGDGGTTTGGVASSRWPDVSAAPGTVRVSVSGEAMSYVSSGGSATLTSVSLRRETCSQPSDGSSRQRPPTTAFQPYGSASPSGGASAGGGGGDSSDTSSGGALGASGGEGGGGEGGGAIGGGGEGGGGEGGGDGG